MVIYICVVNTSDNLLQDYKITSKFYADFIQNQISDNVLKLTLYLFYWA